MQISHSNSQDHTSVINTVAETIPWTRVKRSSHQLQIKDNTGEPSVLAEKIIYRAHSFPWATEFRAETRNLPFAVEFQHYHGISRN